MMVKVSCKDIGGRGDKFVAKGTKVGVVRRKMWAHARKKHKAMVMKLTPASKRRMNKVIARAFAKNKKAMMKKRK
jgi:predicted small metal-binding protein